MARKTGETCATCANATHKMTTEPCATCIERGDSKEADHYSLWAEREV